MSSLFLLLRTRLRYYRNYLRHHFDRRFIVEIILILFIFLYLVGRSPADIGYRLSALTSPDFPPRWAVWWVALLPAFYFLVEFMAGLTLRRSGEWQLLGSLPFTRDTMTHYHLLRHACGMKVLIARISNALPRLNRGIIAANAVAQPWRNEEPEWETPRASRGGTTKGTNCCGC